MDAVVLQVRPGLVLADPLVPAVRLDQPQERLPRQVEAPDRRLHVAQHRPRRLAGERRVDLPLELVERCEPVTRVGVAELVDEARVAVERTDVRTQRPREEDRADREVLAGGPRCDLGELPMSLHVGHSCLNGRVGGGAARESRGRETTLAKAGAPSPDASGGRDTAVTGIDRQKVGQVAAEMRALRPPDPYKNKGVRYSGERLKKKVGKTGAK